MSDEPPNKTSPQDHPNIHTNNKITDALIKLIFGWPFIGSLFLACGAGLWGFIGNSRTAYFLVAGGFSTVLFLVAHKIWLCRTARYFVPSILSALIFGGFVFSTKEPKEIQKPRWQPPQMPSDCDVGYFILGNSTLKMDIADMRTNNREFVPPGLESLFKVKISDNRLYLEPPPDLKHRELINENTVRPEFVTNKIRGLFTDITYLDQMLPSDFDRNYSVNELEVINDYGVPILQVIYDRPNTIRVNFILPFINIMDRSATVLWVFGLRSGSIHSPKEYFDSIPMLRSNLLFKYPSRDHLGERAN